MQVLGKTQKVAKTYGSHLKMIMCYVATMLVVPTWYVSQLAYAVWGSSVNMQAVQYGAGETCSRSSSFMLDWPLLSEIRSI